MSLDGKMTIQNRKLYLPQLSYEGARCLAAAFQSVGIDAVPTPPGDAQTLELARKYLSGDECLPEAVTLGDFLKISQQPDYDPEKTAFFLPTSNGPCRFGHYLPLACKIFKERNEREVYFFSTSSSGGYEDIGAGSNDFVRTAWRAVLVSDVLRKLLFKTRPYELNAGMSDRVFSEYLDKVCKAIATPQVTHTERLKGIMSVLIQARAAFRGIPMDNRKKLLLIGVVGEIFCRLNDFSNDFLVRLIEKYGGEVWMSDVNEWIWYTKDEECERLTREGRRFSFGMFGARLRMAVMRYDEQKILEPFHDDFKGYEEPDGVNQILKRSQPYLPREGAHGEMVLNVGKAIWYYEKGASAVIDISPFTCMNGIVCEAVYPRVSKDHRDFPIRLFYFDGIHSNVEGDLEIFMELARNYSRAGKRG
jgi:predicted nucleotide-binding protein (sugar kinase/HSP70/actin superfamily)